MTAPTKPNSVQQPQVSPSTQAMLDLLKSQSVLLSHALESLVEQTHAMHQIADTLQLIAANTAPSPTNGHAPAQQTASRPIAPAGPVQTFKAALLEGSVNAGKSYWKVKGGPFTKYGVTVWPEVLAMHTIFNNLAAGGTKDLTGWTAEYITKQNDKGDTVPDKVVRLIAPGFAGEEF